MLLAQGSLATNEVETIEERTAARSFHFCLFSTPLQDIRRLNLATLPKLQSAPSTWPRKAEPFPLSAHPQTSCKQTGQRKRPALPQLCGAGARHSLECLPTRSRSVSPRERENGNRGAPSSQCSGESPRNHPEHRAVA